MYFTKRYEDAQLKVNANAHTRAREAEDAHTRAREAEDARVLKRPELYGKSWSATHPAYYGTSLCPKKDWGEGHLKESVWLGQKRNNQH